MINRGFERFAMKYSTDSIWEAIGIDKSNTSREIVLSQSDIILVLLQIAMAEFEIRCFEYLFQDS